MHRLQHVYDVLHHATDRRLKEFGEFTFFYFNSHLLHLFLWTISCLANQNDWGNRKRGICDDVHRLPIQESFSRVEAVGILGINENYHFTRPCMLAIILRLGAQTPALTRIWRRPVWYVHYIVLRPCFLNLYLLVPATEMPWQVWIRSRFSYPSNEAIGWLLFSTLK